MRTGPGPGATGPLTRRLPHHQRSLHLADGFRRQRPAAETIYRVGVRGRLALGVVGLMLNSTGLVLGLVAAMRGELSTAETICGAAVVALVVAVCVTGICTRSRLLRRERDEPEA